MDKEIKRPRALTASDVECRVATCKASGVSLLLYKTARCDMQILDETYGPMNWQRRHSRDNANCTIAVWDDDKKQWVEKEDTGTESNTEAEKGLASDSFKRAGFNWGIGRELYTAPFIWISAANADVVDSGRKDKWGKPIYQCNTAFPSQLWMLRVAALRRLPSPQTERPYTKWVTPSPSATPTQPPPALPPAPSASVLSKPTARRTTPMKLTR